MAEARTRQLAVVAQDPGVRHGRQILTAEVVIPFEDLEPGPAGHRVQVVDYDASTRTLYSRARLADGASAGRLSNAVIMGQPGFHAQNVYALVMRTLGRFEAALGRRVAWGFRAHQLKVVPHAFEDANAFYSPESESLLFGYFRRDRRLVFTCLSHDIVVHETTHALVDGLRGRFLRPSSPDQAAFHEGYADIVALLSVFSFTGLLENLLDRGVPARGSDRRGLIGRAAVSADRLRRSVLFGLAEDMDPEIAGARVNALRRSIELEPDEGVLDRVEFVEEHRRGEVLVAAVMRAFLEVWTRRLAALGTVEGAYLDRSRVAEEGAVVADQLLTMAIRALDYTPPVHLRFGDFLSAMLTADSEVRTDDSRYDLRATLRRWFAAYGINPASRSRTRKDTEEGLWKRSDLQLAHEGVRFGSLQTDPTEMFRLVWANRRDLYLDVNAYTRIASVRPCLRIGPEDGLPVRETVGECIQYVELRADELDRYNLVKPDGMPDDTEIVLEGGSTLILDEYGMLKFEIHNRLPRRTDRASLAVAQGRLEYLWEQGYYDKGHSFAARISSLHRRRAWEAGVVHNEAW